MSRLLLTATASPRASLGLHSPAPSCSGRPTLPVYLRCIGLHRSSSPRVACTPVASSGQAPPTSGPSRIARDLAPLALDEAQLAKVADHVSKTAAERDLAASVEALVTYTGSARSARGLALQHPDLLACQLPSWCDFLTGFGLDKSQLQHLLCSAPEALTRGDLVRAGEAMLTMRRLGLCERSAAQLVTYYPQLLNKDEPEILSLLKLLGRYQIGIDTTTL